MGWLKGLKFRFRPLLGQNIQKLNNTRHLELMEEKSFKDDLSYQLDAYLSWIASQRHQQLIGPDFLEKFGFSLEIAPRVGDPGISYCQYGIDKEFSFQHFGFPTLIAPSMIAGNGVFLSAGFIRRHTLVALYPGTVYQPGDPVFFQSLNNHVMLECIDRKYIDAKAHGISKSVFKSCEGRDRIFPGKQSADTSWIEERGSEFVFKNSQYCNIIKPVFKSTR